MQLDQAKKLAVEYGKELVYTGPGTFALEDHVSGGPPDEMFEAQIAEMQSDDFIDFYLS
jgi:hypothetical protein